MVKVIYNFFYFFLIFFNFSFSQIEKINAKNLLATQLRRFQHLLQRFYKGVLMNALINSLTSKNINYDEI